jgi:hypothetical protein
MDVISLSGRLYRRIYQAHSDLHILNDLELYDYKNEKINTMMSEIMGSSINNTG